MTDFTTPSDRETLRASLTDEEWQRVKAAEPGGGGGPKSKYFGGAKAPDNFALFGGDLFGDEIKQDVTGAIRQKFEFPPFSVLNAREGAWQTRKRAWLACGIKSEIGRGATPGTRPNDNALLEEGAKGLSAGLAQNKGRPSKVNTTPGGGSPRPAMDYSNRERGDGYGKTLAQAFGQKFALGAQPAHGGEGKSWEKNDHTVSSSSSAMELAGGFDNANGSSGTSIFDPVVCELMYRWFCPPNGLILDPFAGGSVRGIVAGLLNYRYHGIDLRPEQIAANEQQRDSIAPDADIHWRVGDSNLLLPDAPEADLIFSCPPYGDLEVYSDDPQDISTMTWEGFVAAYRSIIKKSVERLKSNRFACFVVGEYRDKKTGLYRGFVPLTCAMFQAAGAALYNEIILVTAVGSLPIRVTKQFETSRKVGKTHQNIIIGIKGDPKIAAEVINGRDERAAETRRVTVAARTVEPAVVSPISSAPVSENLFDTPIVTVSSPSGNLASFLSSPQASRHDDWRPDEPPDLTGIDHIVLNFATTGLEWAKGDRPVGVTVSTLDGQMTRFLPFAFRHGGNLDEAAIKRWAQEQLRGKKITNARTKFDIHYAREWGVDLEAQGCTFSDIQHTAALLDDHRKQFKLDVLGRDYFPDDPAIARVDESRHADHHASEVAERELFTARLVGRLHAVMYPELAAQELQDVQTLEDDVIPAVVEMEKNGSKLNVELLHQYHEECMRRHDAMSLEVSHDAGFSFDHSAKAWQRLFEKLGLPPTDGNDESIIGAIDHPLVKKAHLAAQYASLDSKTFSPYLANVDANGILRVDINQLRGEKGGTVSGRFSIGYVQQVPNADNHSLVFGDELFPRRLFIAANDADYLEADAMQIEQRLLVHYAGNQRVIDQYVGDLERLMRGEDTVSYHKVTWAMIKERKSDMLYSHQKNFNFAFQSGAKTIKLAVMMGFISEAEGDEIRQAKRWDDPRLKVTQEIEAAFKAMMPEGHALLDKASHLAKASCDKYCRQDALHRQLQHRGYVKTLVGRRSRFPKNYKTYIGLNRVLQGSGADIMKRKLTELHRERKNTGLLMRLTVHDAVGGDILMPETKARVSEILNRQSYALKVPILWHVKSGPTWADCH